MPRHDGVDLYGLGANDPDCELVDRSGLEPSQLERIGRLMAAMGRLRTVERRIFEAGQRYMRLNETDMRAIHYLMACGNQGIEATPGMLAAHLDITTASTTKLLDRLEKGGHVVRSRHSLDRRALALTVTPQTRSAAVNTMGRHHAARIKAAAALSDAECETVIGFLLATADDMESTLETEI